MGGSEEVKVLGIVGSPFVPRVEIALKLKGIEYEYIHESLEHKSHLLLKYNPVHQTVPVLVHNGKPIAESRVIVEYVDEAWSGYPILPSHPYQRALARFWSKFIDEKVLPPIFKAAFNSQGKEREQNEKEALDALRILENELKNKFFGGDSIGFVDIIALYIAFWLSPIQEVGGLFKDFNTENFPNLHQWSHEILQNPIVQSSLPPRDNLVARVKVKMGLSG